MLPCFRLSVHPSVCLSVCLSPFSFLAYYWPQRSCGQGNIFTSVCHSVHREGGFCLNACWDTSPPQTRQTPPHRDKTPPDQEDPPRTRQTPPPDQADPPGKQTPAYGLRAAGTHPTGMHSCFAYLVAMSLCNLASTQSLLSLFFLSLLSSSFSTNFCAQFCRLVTCIRKC